MSDDKSEKLAPNDRINKAAQELGYCCAYLFLCDHSRERDTHAKLASKLKVGVSTIEFNRRKLRNGQLKCLGLSECQKQQGTEQSNDKE